MSTSSLDSLINRLARTTAPRIHSQQQVPTPESAPEPASASPLPFEGTQEQSITSDDAEIINELLGDFLPHHQPAQEPQETVPESPAPAQNEEETHDTDASSLTSIEIIPGLPRRDADENPVHDSPTNVHSLADYSTSRFSGAAWYSKVRDKTITIVGCGGIGRF